MLVITLSPERTLPPGEDDLGRDRVGYKPTMSPGAVYDANHGTWHLGKKALEQRYALFSFEGTVIQAISIDDIERVAGTYAGREASRRSVIHGTILANGHSIHDQYVGQRSPIPPQRNPVGYFKAPEELAQTFCSCGCGGQTDAEFLTGHDQAALHDRVRQIGTVKEFIEWFNNLRKPF